MLLVLNSFVHTISIVAAKLDLTAAKHMRRFYRLDVQPNLFGQWCFIREWGRIGHAGQVREVPYAIAAEAHEALVLQQRVKERRGYWVRKPEG
jgi:predicted DNA-binding WGR domain protein